ncbi:MAG: hypothetical protein ACOC24_04605 [Desulfovibrionales bacterium]
MGDYPKSRKRILFSLILFGLCAKLLHQAFGGRGSTFKSLGWKGIGAFVAKNPHYRTLYGPVSISDSYQTISKRYMLEFLRRFHNGGELERLVRPHHPPRFAKDGWPDIKSCFGEGVRSMEDLSDLVRDVEPGLRDVPVLLRQYLRLGGSVIGFNTDKTFGNALDGLIVVDLTRVEPGLLKRFMGRADAKRYLSERFTA